MKSVLHITNWYPNPWDDVEGNFVKAQYDLFREVSDAKLVNVKVRIDKKLWFRLVIKTISQHEQGVYLLTRISSQRIQAMLTTIMVLCVLMREKVWRYDILHFHIAWPLLAHVHVWKYLIRIPIIISEHWSAYHYNFHLPENSPALKRMRHPFRQGFTVMAVSEALLGDISTFSGVSDLNGSVIPNVVPLHGCSYPIHSRPVLFAVNRWESIKDPIPMLHGLVKAAEQGAKFDLVLGGYGTLVDDMKQVINSSVLRECTRFEGKMTKSEIAMQLGVTDGYIFSSHYETFSVACAEALGAGVPLVGPLIPAISEYAGSDEWVCVEHREAESWRLAIICFIARASAKTFDKQAIAGRAEVMFSPHRIKKMYLSIIS